MSSLGLSSVLNESDSTLMELLQRGIQSVKWLVIMNDLLRVLSTLSFHESGKDEIYFDLH